MASSGPNRVLCDVLTTPGGCVFTIEDAAARGTFGLHVGAEPDADVAVAAPQRALWVRTMDMHECSVFGRLVRVRVLDGADGHGLGTLVFDGRLRISSGVLAIGDARSPDRRVLFGPPSTVRVGVFVEYAVEVLHFDDPAIGYPVSGPSDVNVLLYGAAGFAPAVPDIARPRWRRIGSQCLGTWVAGIGGSHERRSH